MKRIKGLKGVIIFAFLAVLIAGYYYYLSNRTQTKEEGDTVTITAVQETLSRNLEINYPATPKEVIKYFSEITQCYYNEEYSQDELVALADKMLLLYDDELVSYKSHDNYIMDLKKDIDEYKENNYRVSSYSPSASTDVEYFTEDGYEWARIWCLYNIKSGKYSSPITEVFILRKDEKSHWRIFGWKLVENE